VQTYSVQWWFNHTTLSIHSSTPPFFHASSVYGIVSSYHKNICPCSLLPKCCHTVEQAVILPHLCSLTGHHLNQVFFFNYFYFVNYSCFMYFEFRCNYFSCTNTYTASEFSLCLLTVVLFVITPSCIFYFQNVCITSLLAIRLSLCPCALNMFKEK